MFHIHWGDSPHQTYGEILMPGAFRAGIIAGVLSEDDMQLVPDTPGPNCELRTTTKGVLARAYIPAASPEELATICQVIGGLQPIPARPLTRGERFILGFRYLWIRRPHLRIAFRDTP